MESKMDFETLKMIRTFLFLYRFDWIIFVRCPPPTPSSLPVNELKVTGIIANEPIHHVSNVSGLLSEVRIDQSEYLISIIFR
jgi:hypothetical protein